MARIRAEHYDLDHLYHGIKVDLDPSRMQAPGLKEFRVALQARVAGSRPDLVPESPALASTLEMPCKLRRKIEPGDASIIDP